MTQQHPLRLLHKGQGKVSSSMGIKIKSMNFVCDKQALKTCLILSNQNKDAEVRR